MLRIFRRSRFAAAVTSIVLLSPIAFPAAASDSALPTGDVLFAMPWDETGKILDQLEPPSQTSSPVVITESGEETAGRSWWGAAQDPTSGKSYALHDGNFDFSGGGFFVPPGETAYVLFELDTESGSASDSLVILPPAPGQDWRPFFAHGLAFDQEGNAFTVFHNQAAGKFDHYLVRINLETGKTSVVTEFPAMSYPIESVAIHPESGKMYFGTTDYPGLLEYVLDLNAPSTTTSALVIFPPVLGLQFDSDGTLWATKQISTNYYLCKHIFSTPPGLPDCYPANATFKSYALLITKSLNTVSPSEQPADVVVDNANVTPEPYRGPILTEPGAKKTFAGERVLLRGEKLDQVRAVSVGNKPTSFSAALGELSVLIPSELDPGTYDLIVDSTGGKVTFIDAFQVRLPRKSFSFTTKSVGGLSADSMAEHILVSTLQSPDLTKIRCVVNASNKTSALRDAKKLCGHLRSLSPHIVESVLEVRSTVTSRETFSRVVYGWAD